MPKPTKIFYDRLENAIQLYINNQNLSVLACAEVAYISASALTKELKKRGLTRNLNEIQNKKLEDGIQFYLSGLSIFAASRKASIGNNTLGQALNNRGLLRPQTETRAINLQNALSFYQQGMAINIAAMKAGIGNNTLINELKKQELLRCQDEKNSETVGVYLAEIKENRIYSMAVELLHRAARSNHVA
ncbi:hypothetical protein [Shewanella baltica]|uniref:hypothetical protein n=1 Tax=Shewanella baltica TaxID=62322 RepID=UPI002169B691|nr:hypothetical protein [Shewanella baltica]MCS6113046.1 hypothetical protein [Shewanella baltica]UVW64245.1 hypothetical protein HHE93_11880 [Shewanella baltica]